MQNSLPQSICVTVLMVTAIAAVTPAKRVAANDDVDTAVLGMPRTLFDGKSLDGWEGNQEWFRVDAGTIVAGSMDREIPHNHFLCTEQAFTDFELSLDVKLVGPGDNAGVQFRSRRIADSTEVIGYQADAGSAWSKPVWGGLYDESRRREMLVWPDPSTLDRVLKVGDWNTLKIRAIGPRIEIFVNGAKTADYTEPDDSIQRVGVIALQIHSGPASEAHYRSINIATPAMSTDAQSAETGRATERPDEQAGPSQ